MAERGGSLYYNCSTNLGFNFDIHRPIDAYRCARDDFLYSTSIERIRPSWSFHRCHRRNRSW